MSISLSTNWAAFLSSVSAQNRKRREITKACGRHNFLIVLYRLPATNSRSPGLIDWSLMALSAQLGYIVPLEDIVCILENGSTLGVLYISYSVVDDQQHK